MADIGIGKATSYNDLVQESLGGTVSDTQLDVAVARSSDITALNTSQAVQDALLAAAATKLEVALVQAQVTANVDKSLQSAVRQVDNSILLTWDDGSTVSVLGPTQAPGYDDTALEARTTALENTTIALEASQIVQDNDRVLKATQVALDAEKARTDALETSQGTQDTNIASNRATTAEALLIPKSDIGTSTEVDAALDVNKLVNVVELKRKLDAQNVTGDYIGSSNTFSTLPTTNATKAAANGDWATLTELDGVNLRGVYLYNGTTYTFAFELGSDVLELLNEI